MRRPTLTLGQVFVLTIVGLVALLGVLFSLLYRGSRQSIVDSSSHLLRATSAALGERLDGYLRRAQTCVEDVERLVRYGSCHPEDALSVEAHLFAAVLNDKNLAEVTFTHAAGRGFAGDGSLRVDADGRWQVSVFRETPDPDAPILTRITYQEGKRFVTDVRRRVADGSLLGAPLLRQAGAAAPDPTEHPTFTTTTLRRLYGQPVWSDLSYAEQDAARPEAQRRVVVTVMKAIDDRAGSFAGVVRAGLRTEEVDRIVSEVQAGARRSAPYTIFICDNEGRLITRLTPGSALAEQPDLSLRLDARDLPPAAAQALAHPALRQVDAGHLETTGSFVASGRRYLVSFKGLPYTQGWRIGAVVGEDDLPGIAALLATRDRLLRWSLVLMAAILLGGVATVRIVQRGLGRIVDSAARMRGFDFAPTEHRSSIRDIEDVTVSLELAKTALRAMGKYVPIDLVRLLYQTGREPVLGGELARVSLMFTDIKDFTTLSERLSPNELAQILGRYLEVMTTAIHGQQGTIDKYIGDAIMAVWNVPTPCPSHPVNACQAALACVEAGDALYRSPEWEGKPALVTRFGLHTADVIVGHFGAPDRMSYTELGDGVNLASRLEGLNKQYGTTILASEAVYGAAKARFAFRLVDVVAVKGRTQGVRVYELLGDAGRPVPETVRLYGEALDAYLRRDFAFALRLLEDNSADGPSRVLAERCRALAAEPPPLDWNGVYVAHEK